MEAGVAIAAGRRIILDLGAEAGLAAPSDTAARVRNQATRVVVKPNPIERHLHDLVISAAKSHGLVLRLAGEGIWVSAIHRGVEEIDVVHRVVAGGRSAIGLAGGLRIG